MASGEAINVPRILNFKCTPPRKWTRFLHWFYFMNSARDTNIYSYFPYVTLCRTVWYLRSLCFKSTQFWSYCIKRGMTYNYCYSPFAETRQRKQSNPRIATADSKAWTKRAVSSVYSLHSDARLPAFRLWTPLQRYTRHVIAAWFHSKSEGDTTCICLRWLSRLREWTIVKKR
jgi:hypothetical protein